MAERDVSESATDVFPFRNNHRGAEQDCRNQSRLNRITVDRLTNEFIQNERTLRVADQYKAAAFVVVLEIVFPCIHNIIVAKPTAQRLGGITAGKPGAQPEKRYLPIDWCI